MLQDDNYKREFKKQDEDKNFQKFLKKRPPQTKAESVPVKGYKKGLQRFDERFLNC